MNFNLHFHLRNKIGLMALLCIMSIGVSHAQSQTITGLVTSDEQPLPGVSIIVKGSSKGTVTDFDGGYTIRADANSVLVFSYVGFINQEITVGTNTTINVSLVEDITKLDEVVVVGYGRQKRIEVSGSVSSVKGEDIQKFTSNNFQDALQGKVAGVTVLSSGGEPGAQPIIQIRGTNTLSSGRRGRRDNPNFNLLNPTTDGLSPLYIVDGVQLEANPNLSSSDIESIEILKDAATTSIYGTRGAAGVIIITTKQGKIGKAKIEFNTNQGIKKVTNSINLANTADAFLIDRTIHENNTPDLRYFSILDRNKDALDFDNDWQDFVVNDYAQSQNSNLRVSGGNSDVSYNVNLDHFKEEGIYKKSNLERINLRTFATVKKGKFKANIGGNVSTGNRRLSPWGLMYDAVRLSPYQATFTIGEANVQTPVGAVQPDGGVFTSTNNVTGPLARKFAADNKRKEYNFGANIGLEYQILKQLKARVNISGFRSSTESRFYSPRQEIRSEETGELTQQPTVADLTVYNTIYQAFNKDVLLDYDQYFGKHRIALLLGAEVRELLWQDYRVSVNDFLSPEQRTIGDAANISQRRESISPSISNSYFSRLKYEYDGKYFLLGNIRRNGSSKFFDGKKIGYFGGVSGAWVVSKENFFRNSEILSFISNMKLRASWGTVGNDRIPDNTFNSAFLSNANPVFGGGPVFGGSRFNIGNKEIVWETTESRNFGVDLGLFKGALSFTADYYVADKSDLLFQLPTLISAGVIGRPIQVNIASLTNEGLELALNYSNNRKQFKWSVSATYTRNENIVNQLNTDADIINGGFPLSAANAIIQTPVTFIRPGYSAGAFFLIPTEGVIKTQEELDEYNSRVTERLGRGNQIGDMKFTDKITEDLMMPLLGADGQPIIDADGNVTMVPGEDGILDSGDGVINDDDRIFMGNNIPDFEAGLNFNFRYKNLDLNMQWFGMFGHKVFNGPKNLAYAFGTHKDIAYQFSALNPNSNIPSRRPNGTEDPNISSSSDLYIENGDFVRLRNIQLGYTLPKDVLNNIFLDKFRLYISGQNLLTITKYDGYDPEIGGDGLATRGIDTGLQPVTAQLILGLQVAF